MIRVFVFDEHALVREGLEHILASAPDLVSAGSADDPSAVLADLDSVAVDALVLDPSDEGEGLLHRVRAGRPDLPIVVHSAWPEEQVGARMLAAGAQAYLSKRRATAELLRAIRVVVRGGRYVTAPIARRMLDPATRRFELTRREREILQLVVNGQQTTCIAHGLEISPSTVSTHLRRIKHKLGVESNVELVRFALVHRLAA